MTELADLNHESMVIWMILNEAIGQDLLDFLPVGECRNLLYVSQFGHASFDIERESEDEFSITVTKTPAR